jgi:hypothetical protein
VPLFDETTITLSEVLKVILIDASLCTSTGRLTIQPIVDTSKLKWPIEQQVLVLLLVL